MALSIGSLVAYIGVDLGEFDKKLDEAGEKLKSGGEGGGLLAKAKAGGIAVGLALGAAVGASIKEAMDVQAANAKLAGQLGLTKAESARIGKAAGKLYSDNYGESLADVNDAIASVVQNVDGMRDANNAALQDVTAKVIDVAGTFDQDLGGVTKAVGQLMRTGLAKDATQALDIITFGLQNIPGAGEDLLDTLNEYDVQFQSLGLSGPQALGFIQAAMKGGARNTDLAADALKEFNLRARNVNDSGAAFKALGFNAKQMAEAFAGGGAGAEAAMVKTLTAIRNIPDPMQRSAIATQLLGSQAEDLQGALLGIDPTQLTANLGKLDGAADSLDKTIGGTAKGTIETWRRKAEMAFVTLIGGKILPALQAAGSWLMTKLGPAIDWVKDKWPTIAAAISQAWFGMIWPAIQSFGEKVGYLAEGILKPFVQWISDNWPAISSMIADGWNNYLAPALQKVGGILSWIYTSALKPLVDYANAHGPEIQTTLSGAAHVIAEAFRILGGIISFVFSTAKAAWDTATVGWQAASALFSGAAHGVSSAFSGIGSAASAAWTALTTAWSTASTWFTNLKTTITTALSDAGSWLLDVGKNIVSGLVTGISNAAGWLKDQVVSIIKDAIPGPIRKLLGISSPSKLMASEVGQWIPKGIALGIDQHADVVAASMRNLVDVPSLAAAVTPLTMPVGGSAGLRGGDGAAAGVVTPGTYIAKQIHQDVKITAGWSAKETDAYLDMQIGPR